MYHRGDVQARAFGARAWKFSFPKVLLTGRRSLGSRKRGWGKQDQFEIKTEEHTGPNNDIINHRHKITLSQQTFSQENTMSSIPDISLKLDPRFLEDCLTISSSTHPDPDTPVPPTVTRFRFRAATLTANYPNAYSDFYGSGSPCIYKTGPAWPVREGPEAQGIVREARPIYGHRIGPVWPSIGKLIYEYLDSNGVMWSCMDPLAYANEGQGRPFCPFILSIGVVPYSLVYEDAVAAASGVKKILAQASFFDIEVAFVESVVTRSVSGPRLLPFDPLIDDVPEFRKPFTPTLGLSIAPLRFIHYGGTGGLYYRLSNEDDRVALLTCAHVARPPPVFPNTGVTRGNNSQPREEIVALGDGAYSKAVTAMMCEIGDQVTCIKVWNNVLRRLGDPVQGENPKITQKRDEHLDLVEKAEKRISEVNELYEEVTKCRTTPDHRVIGFILHSEPIKVSTDPFGFTEDWALIELYKEKFDWNNFKGNKVYVGGNLSIADFRSLMFPQPADQADYQYPEDGLLQAYGIVPEAEMRNPQYLDVHGEKCMLVVKNGLKTGTTVGRVNGLESFKRTHKEYGIVEQTSIEIAVLSYNKTNKTRDRFSDTGDSGSVVLARDGRILGILTGGAGPPNRTDITYVTPYWWLEEQIKAKYPSAFLYQVVS